MLRQRVDRFPVPDLAQAWPANGDRVKLFGFCTYLLDRECRD